MPLIVDMENTLFLFVEEVNKGMPLSRCNHSSDLRVWYDKPNGSPRFTYAKLFDGNVVGIACFVRVDDFEGVPTFNIGYAIEGAFRNAGHATHLVTSALKELSEGLKSQGIPRICVEAGIEKDNLASLRVAEKVLSPERFESKDPASKTAIYAFRAFI